VLCGIALIFFGFTLFFGVAYLIGVSLIPLVYLYFALHRSIVEPRAGFVEFSRRRKRRNGGPGHRLLHHHSLVRGGRLRAWTSMKVRRGTDHRPVYRERPRYPVSRAGCGDRSGHKSMAMTKRYDHANEERYGAAIEALDKAGKTSSAEALAAARWKRT
jgi:hypothetical protein